MTAPRIAALLLPAALLACSSARSAPPPPSPEPATPGEVVARVNGRPITLAEVDAQGAGALQRIRDQEYEARKRALDELIGERLLEVEAEARGLSKKELVQREVEAKITRPTREEITALYEANRHRVGGRTLAELYPEIERSMVQQRSAEREQAFQDELRQKAAVKVTLAQPRITLPIPAEARTLGPDKAPVTLVEYSDYLCPYCQRAQEAVDQVLARYPGKVRFVHRDFLLGRPRSLAVARAAHCAADQGKFWEYRHSLMQGGGDWSDEDLLRHAEPLKLDKRALQSCLASDRHDEAIQSASEEGARLGVNSTPTFFVNGRRLTGVRTAEEFAEVIEAELSAGG